MFDLSSVLTYARSHFIPVMADETKNLLFRMVRDAQPRRILEIGTAIGYSGIVMLSAAPEATLNTVELNEDFARIAAENFRKAGVSSRANIFVGDAKEIVMLLTGEYDFVFLDGPKGQYEVFLHYLTDLLSVGGTLVCDDVLYLGYVEHVPEDKRHKHITIARNMRAFLDDLMQNPRYQTTLFRIDDGVTVSKKLR